jgi:uncharacterized protein YdeI (YjbR/CyaY-like superfamily)
VKPTYFRDGAEFRRWLATHHDSAAELLLGFHKVKSAKRGITYQQALDEALCFGWIDGVRRSVDDSRYTIRFTPRRPKSNWSRVNVDRVGVLTTAGRMHSAGLDAFRRRDESKDDSYSYEVRSRPFDAESERQIRAEPRAWEFLQAQSAWFKRNAAFWVASAKREETRARRLESLIDHMRRGMMPPGFARPPRTTGRAR